MKNLHIYSLLTILTIVCTAVQGYGQSISGPTTVYTGSQETYTYTGPDNHCTWTISGDSSNSPSGCSVTVNWPSNTGSGSVQVSNLDGTFSINVSIVNPPPPPNPPTVTGSQDCGTGKVTFTASSSQGSIFKWYNNAAGTGTLLHQGSTYAPQDVHPAGTSVTMYATVTNSNGTSNTGSGTANRHLVPGVTTASDRSQCGTGSMTLTATLGSNGNQLRWFNSLSDANNNTNVQDYTTYDVNPSSTTTYYVLTYNTTTGCAGPVQDVEVTINPLPQGGYVLTGGGTICEGNSVNLSLYKNGSYNTESGVEYRLYLGAQLKGGPIQGGSTVTFTNISDEGSYTVKGTKSGCEATVLTSQASVNVTDLPDSRTNTSSASYCSNESSGTSVYLYNRETDVTYGLYKVGQSTTTSSPVVSGNNIRWDNVPEGTYDIKGTRAGCTSWVNQTDVVVTADAIPGVPVISSSLTENCGSTVISKETANANWYWTLDQNNPSTSNSSNTYTVTEAQAPVTVYLMAYNGDCWSAADQITISSVLTGPDLSISGNTSLCVGGSSALTASSQEAISYIWTENSSGNIVSTNASYTTPELASTATYNITAYSIEGCSTSQNVSVTVLPPETHQPDVPVISWNGSAYLLESNNTNGGGYTYAWVSGREATDGSGHADIQTTEYGRYYYLRAQNSNGCWGPASVIRIPDLSTPVYSTAIQTSQVNVVTAHTYRQAGLSGDPTTMNSDQVSTTISYSDGLGRPVQSLAIDQSYGDNSVVSVQHYDELGRQDKAFLSFTHSGSTLLGQPFNSQKSFYQTEQSVATSSQAFAYSLLEDSPVARMLSSSSPGENAVPYVGESGAVRISYESNTSGDNVLSFSISNNIVVVGSAYAANLLTKQITTDENGNVSMEFQNKIGQTVLKRSLLGTHNVDTYYIYDNRNNLRFVIQPEGVQLIHDNNLVNLKPYEEGVEEVNDDKTLSSYESKSYLLKSNASVTLRPGFTYTASGNDSFFIRFGNGEGGFLDTWAFQYEYDEYNRMVAKKVPGFGWVYMVYDSWDRLVLTQDANQRAASEWTFTKYDQLDRPIMTGVIVDGREHDVIQASIESETTRGEQNGSTVHGYSNVTFPSVTSTDVYTVTYYDDYGFTLSFSHAFDSNHAYETSSNGNVKGQITGSKTLILGTTSYLESVNYYDDYYRVLQTQTLNQFGKIDITSSDYDFLGNVIAVKSDYVDASDNVTVTVKQYTYDHGNRLLKATHKFNNESVVTIAQNEYNEIGELIKKELHENQGNAVQTVDYTYNIKGWLTDINDISALDDDVFGLHLAYEDVVNGATSQNNGNISSIQWTDVWHDITESGKNKLFTYSYDNLNRIATGNYATGNGTTWLTNVNDFTVNNISYDKNGNILSLKRKGVVNDVQSTIDDLSYQYSGNRLLQVEDNGTAEGFDDGSSSSEEYLYDANGNMISDSNKEITSITYNYLNLPEEVEFAGTDKRIKYTYDASGIKLSQKVFDGSSTPEKETYYAGDLIYRASDTLDIVLHDEGRVDVNLADPEYQYFIKDHLGNTRVLFGSNNEIDYSATMELALDAQESVAFANLDTRHLDATHDHTHLITSGNEAYSSYLDATSSQIVGPAIMLALSPGDTVEMSVYGQYSNTGTHSTIAQSTLISDLSDALVTASSALIETTTAANSILTDAFNLIGSYGNGSTTAPRTYLNYILFDQNLDYVQSGFDPIAEGSGWDLLGGSGFEVTSDDWGYIYIWVSNESQNSTVWFDDMLVTHKKNPMRENTDYYPFGMTMTGTSYQRSGTMENRFKYNGKEQQTDLDLDWYDYGARMYDAEIGRWHVVDPLADAQVTLSPYHFAYDNPIRFNDPSGMIGEDFRQNIMTVVVNEDTNEEYEIDDGYDFRFYVSGEEFDEIKEAESIEGTSAYNRWFWNAVGYELKNSNSDDRFDRLMHFFFYEDAGDAVITVSEGQYAGAALTLALSRLKIGKGSKLVRKLFKYGKNKRIPTPDMDLEQFERKAGKYVHKKTGAIYSKSYTSHGNVGNKGDQWKVWPKGTTDFGKTSKKAGTRVTIDGNGNVIGN